MARIRGSGQGRPSAAVTVETNVLVTSVSADLWTTEAEISLVSFLRRDKAGSGDGRCRAVPVELRIGERETPNLNAGAYGAWR